MQPLFPSFLPRDVHSAAQQTQLHQVARVLEPSDSHKGLLDTSRRDEPVEDADRASLVVRSACTASSEGLLAYDGARAFVVVVDVPGSVSEFVGGEDESLTVLREAKDDSGISGVHRRQRFYCDEELTWNLSERRLWFCR